MSNSSNTSPVTTHKDALRGLDFYNEDLKILEGRLAEVASKNNSFEARQGIEHFQNQFDIQQKNIHDLMHKLREHEPVMAREAQKHASQVSLAQVEKEKKLLDEYVQLEKVINELRQEFNIFLSKWM